MTLGTLVCIFIGILYIGLHVISFIKMDDSESFEECYYACLIIDVVLIATTGLILMAIYWDTVII